jgi:ankyrin repeat protein
MASPEQDVVVLIKPILLILTGLLIWVPASGNLDSGLDEIEKLIRLRDYPEAVSRLSLLADRGDSEARYRLAGLYRSGKGVTRDLDKATELYYQSAQAGFADAQYTFAVIIEKSSDSPSSRREALRWFKKSALQGNQRALDKLEQLRLSPDALDQDIKNSDIFEAIQHNDGALLESLISSGADLNLIDRYGNSAVMAALLAGWPLLAESLITETNNLGQVNSFGSGPLHIASARGYKDIVTALLDNKVDINQANSRGDTALIIAVRNNDTDLAGLLLERGADYSLTNEKEQSAVDLAYTGDDPSSKALFESYGIEPRVVKKVESVNSLDTFKGLVKKHGARYDAWPLLNIAIELGDKRVSKQILAQQPDLDLTDRDGNTALHVAARKGDFAMLEQLVSRNANVNAVNKRNESALFLAVESASLKSVNLLLRNKADPSIATKQKTTPLEIAVRSDQVQIARALLKIRVAYPGVHSALLLAIQKKMEELSISMIQLDEQLGLLDNKKRSVLWHSAAQGLEKTTTLLIGARKIDLNAKDISGYTALAQALVNGHSKIVRLLFEHKADLSVRTNEGNNLLMLAVLSEQPDLVEFLLSRGVELDTQNNVGDTALMIAAARAQNQIVEMLIYSGANPQLRNKDDLNAFQIATSSGHSATAKIIHDSSSIIFKVFN